MADHEQGSMNIQVQERTFGGFIRFLKWGTGLSIFVLVFLALANA